MVFPGDTNLHLLDYNGIVWFPGFVYDVGGIEGYRVVHDGVVEFTHVRRDDVKCLGCSRAGSIFLTPSDSEITLREEKQRETFIFVVE